MNLGQFKKSGKLFTFVLVVVCLLVLAIFGGRQAATYFARASTCPASKVSATQVSSNAAVVGWETADVSQGRVEYGTSATNLSFSTPEGTSGKTHNVPLTLLTPNTVYYYMITIGSSSCDSTGQSCSGKTCVPFSFTTSSVNIQQQPVETIASPTVVASASVTPTIKATNTPAVSVSTTKAPTVSTPTVAAGTLAPTSGLSAFCQNIPKYMGRTNKDQETPAWSTIAQYDMNGNGIIQGNDISPCQQSGK